MPGHDIIAIGASAGGVEALRSLIKQLPGDLPAALFIVLHIPSDHPSLLPTLLNHDGGLLAFHPADGTPIRNGCIYVAPPDQHLIIEGPIVRVVRGPRENRARPAIDPLFRSVAACYGPRVVGVVLSGSLDDGSAGLRAIKHRGGITVVQDPEEASFREMPESALAAVQVDYCLRLADMAQCLVELASRPPGHNETKLNDMMKMEMEMGAIELNVKRMEDDNRPGTSSPYSCPDCGGVLWEMDDEGLLRFRCRVGHAYLVNSMLAAQSDTVERALWMALKTLEERVSLLRRMIRNANANAHVYLVKRFSEELHSAEEGADAIRKVLIQASPSSTFQENP